MQCFCDTAMCTYIRVIYEYKPPQSPQTPSPTDICVYIYIHQHTQIYICICMSVIHTCVYTLVQYKNTSPCNRREYPPLHTYVFIYAYMNIHTDTCILQYFCYKYMYIYVRALYAYNILQYA